MTTPIPGAYNQSTTTVGTTPTLIAVISGAGVSGVLVQNASGGQTVFLGGANVTASDATAGISLAAGASVLVPTTGGRQGLWLYAVAGSSTATVTVLFASGA